MAAENELNKPKQTATYIDEGGQKQTGVYAQAAENAGLSAPAQMTRRAIPRAEGTAGQAPANTPQGGAAPQGHYAAMENYYQQMYDDQVQQNNAAYEAAAQQAQAATQQQIDALKQGYQGTNRQLYRDYMEHQRTLPQQMAARGYSGGMSESAQLRLRNSYEEGLNENERARMGQESAASAALAQRLYEARAAADAANQQANQQRLGYLTQLQEQQFSDQQQQAATLASAGDFSGYAELGYTPDQISYLENVWAMQNPALAYSLGKISAGTYYQLTGAYPPGYAPARSGSGGGGGGSGGGPKTKPRGDYSKYSDQDIANAMEQGYAVYDSPLRTANALARAAANLTK